MSNDKQRHCRQQGFTLVEVMIALFIFMVIALGLARGEITALRAHNDNLLRDEAVRLAEEQLNDLRSRSANLAAAGFNVPPIPPVNVNIRGGSVQFAPAVRITAIPTQTPGLTLTQIEVAVGWNQGIAQPVLAPTGRDHQVLLSTIVSFFTTP